MTEFTKARIIKAALRSQFSGYEDCNMSGASDFDEHICMGEYPCGLSILSVIQSLGFEVIDLTEAEKKIMQGWT